MVLANATLHEGAATAAERAAQRPLFSFGVLSDVQYANIEDGKSFHGVPRYYRNSLVALRRTVDAWSQQGVDFAMHFGDILDGFQPKDASEASLAAVLSEFARLGTPCYHMLGNHCLYNLPRQTLNDRLGITELRGGPAAGGDSYYSFQPSPQWRVVVLDGYDVSLLGWPEDHPRHQQARRLLDEKNPNTNKNDPTGLVGQERRFVAFNGGASEAQLVWLEQQLQEASSTGQRVIVANHLPLMPGSAPNACLMYNFEAVLQLLRRHSCVAATMAGHTHQNGYVRDEHGIHHVVLPAVLETPPGRDCYGHIDVFSDALRLRGVDTMMSLDLKLDHLPPQPQLAQEPEEPLAQHTLEPVPEAEAASSEGVSSSGAADATAAIAAAVDALASAGVSAAAPPAAPRSCRESIVAAGGTATGVEMISARA